MIGGEFSFFVCRAVLCSIGTTAVANTRSVVGVTRYVVRHVVLGLTIGLLGTLGCYANAVVGAMACLLSLTIEFCS